MTENNDALLEKDLCNLVEYHLLVVTNFDPYSRFGATDKETFSTVIANDPAFAPFFLDNSKYITARLGGNLITSLHRKLGDLYEAIFKLLLVRKLDLDPDELEYSVQIEIDGELQVRTTDGLVIYNEISDEIKSNLDGEPFRINYPDSKGMGFEVRSCYQIGDSKRIQADEHMAHALLNLQIDPIMLIFCNTSLSSPVKRLSRSWNVYQGQETYQFIHKLTNFDLLSFFQRNADFIESIMNQIFDII
jgi:hypothetical protein